MSTPPNKLPPLGRPFADTVVLYSTPTHTERAEQTGNVEKLETVQEIEQSLRFVKPSKRP